MKPEEKKIETTYAKIYGQWCYKQNGVGPWLVLPPTELPLNEYQKKRVVTP